MRCAVSSCGLCYTVWDSGASASQLAQGFVLGLKEGTFGGGAAALQHW